MNDYLSPTGRYIYITPTYKIINPAHDSPISHYEGPIENYDFKNQKNNFDKIQKILIELDEPLTYVYAGKFVGEKRSKVRFLVQSKNRKIWWRKYEGFSDGSASNTIIMDGKEIKLSNWLKKIVCK